MKVALSIILIFSILSCLTIPVYAFPNINTISSETEPAEDSAGCSSPGATVFWVIAFIIAIVIIAYKFIKSSSRTDNTSLAHRQNNTALPADHPALMLYSLTRQCFTNEESILIQCAKDIVREVELQYKTGDHYREAINKFFINNAGYRERLRTHIVKFEGNLYALGFILEIICISRSDIARKILVQSNFIYQNRAGDLTQLQLIDCDQLTLRELTFDEKEELLFDVIYRLYNHLEDSDFRFIEHIEGALSQINEYYSDLCNEFVGYSDFENNEFQFPAITSYIDKNEMVNNYRYNYSKELKTTYQHYFRGNEVYNLRISFILETQECYIEMCTRYKVYMTVANGYYKVYTRKYDFLNGSSFRDKIKEKFGAKHVEAIDKCLNTMGRAK